MPNGQQLLNKKENGKCMWLSLSDIISALSILGGLQFHSGSAVLLKDGVRPGDRDSDRSISSLLSPHCFPQVCLPNLIWLISSPGAFLQCSNSAGPTLLIQVQKTSAMIVLRTNLHHPQRHYHLSCACLQQLGCTIHCDVCKSVFILCSWNNQQTPHLAAS